MWQLRLGTGVRIGAVGGHVVHFPVVSAGIACVGYFLEHLDRNDASAAGVFALVVTRRAIRVGAVATELA